MGKKKRTNDMDNDVKCGLDYSMGLKKKIINSGVIKRLAAAEDASMITE